MDDDATLGKAHVPRLRPNVDELGLGRPGSAIARTPVLSNADRSSVAGVLREIVRLSYLSEGPDRVRAFAKSVIAQIENRV
jgi:hypothetical protein